MRGKIDRETTYSLMTFSSVSPLSLRKAAIMHPVRCLRVSAPEADPQVRTTNDVPCLYCNESALDDEMYP